MRRDNSIGMRENVDQNNSEYGHFSRSEPPGVIAGDIECNYTQIGDKYCLFSSFKLKAYMFIGVKGIAVLVRKNLTRMSI